MSALPYAYAGVNLLATLTRGSLTGQISGILRLSAAGMVTYWRHQYRAPRKRGTERSLWIEEQARKRKTEKQAWLREQAREYREAIEKKEQDF